MALKAHGILLLHKSAADTQKGRKPGLMNSPIGSVHRQSVRVLQSRILNSEPQAGTGAARSSEELNEKFYILLPIRLLGK